LHRAAHHEVVRAPAVVGAVAVAGEGAAEVAGGEGRDLVAQAQAAERGVEVAQRMRQRASRSAWLRFCASWVSKPPRLTKKIWRRAPRPPRGAGVDHAGHHLELLRQRIEGRRAGERVVVAQLGVVGGVVGTGGRRGAEGGSLAARSAVRSACSASIERAANRGDVAFEDMRAAGAADDALQRIRHGGGTVDRPLLLLPRRMAPLPPTWYWRTELPASHTALPEADTAVKTGRPFGRQHVGHAPAPAAVAPSGASACQVFCWSLCENRRAGLGCARSAYCALLVGITSGPTLGRMARRRSLSNMVCSVPITGCSAKLRPWR
jgi:hypothetical protein